MYCTDGHVLPECFCALFCVAYEGFVKYLSRINACGYYFLKFPDFCDVNDVKKHAIDRHEEK